MAKILLVLIVIFFSITSFDLFVQKSLPLIKVKPSPNNYRSDEFVFLRTFYLMKEGVNYYTAFNDSVINDIRRGTLTKDVFAWRMPTIFWLWSVLIDSGFGIGMLFIILTALSLICVYKITENLLSPIILAPYYIDAHYYQTSFLFTEWWGLFFFIFGLTSFINNHNKFTILFFSVSILTRELFLAPIIFMALISFLIRSNRLIFLKILFISLVFYSVHFLLVQNQNVLDSQSNIFSRIHTFDITQFQREIAFSMRQYPFLNFRLPLLISVFTPIIIFIKYLISKQFKYLYLLSSLSLLFFTPFFGVVYNDYWGITFMPLVIAFSPVVLSFFNFKKSRTKVTNTIMKENING